MVYMILLYASLVLGQILITTTNSSSALRHDDSCRSTPAGKCLTADYIYNICERSGSLDDLWGCLCSNNYSSAWSKCSSCGADIRTWERTQPYQSNCSSILSVLCSFAASRTSNIRATNVYPVAATGVNGMHSVTSASATMTGQSDVTSNANKANDKVARIWEAIPLLASITAYLI